MMFAVVTCLCLVMVSTMTGSASAACCSPKKWESQAFDFNVLDATPKNLYSYRLAHDDDLKKEGAYVEWYGTRYTHIIKDYNTMKTHTIDLTSADKPCVTTDFTATFITSCASYDDLGATNVKDVGEAYSGLAPSTIHYDVLKFELDNNVLTMGFTIDTCFPVFQKIKSTPQASKEVDYLFLFYNGTASVQTPEIFTIPASCSG